MGHLRSLHSEQKLILEGAIILFTSRFWNGLLAGSVLGIVLVLFFSPKLRRKALSTADPVVRRIVVGGSRMVRRNTRRAALGMREGMRTIFRR
ncbi:MAG: hypothetical protein XD50_0710 [Clostridia bacterium 41_269]|nr:MAG: hypothetical protein XD50_0710 [Clostridia bacterium 41_269]